MRSSPLSSQCLSFAPVYPSKRLICLRALFKFPSKVDLLSSSINVTISSLVNFLEGKDTATDSNFILNHLYYFKLLVMLVHKQLFCSFLCDFSCIFFICV